MAEHRGPPQKMEMQKHNHRHPNIASVYGFDQHEGVWFLVMECIEAEDLSSILKKGPIPVDEALEIGKQIAEALEAAREFHFDA